MAMQTGQVTVGTSPTLIVSPTYNVVTIKNMSATKSVWFGGSAVTTATGQQLGPGESETTTTSVDIYAVTDAGTSAVSFKKEF
jgi:hypothetical protein